MVNLLDGLLPKHKDTFVFKAEMKLPRDKLKVFFSFFLKLNISKYHTNTEMI